ncbi:hypothetical protein C8A05DRAFT_38301 [Staphylotrichum tortipilum]|uniref:Uncharacterized protein n=1 Tax=Staphylotrichum tortipilum TaxID=2831512 RepID=A0AAN6MC92_9PEZI|nr:hypothetical protein C8A05DRAFT_38301 [Staphylotrichum longicolle]
MSRAAVQQLALRSPIMRQPVLPLLRTTPLAFALAPLPLRLSTTTTRPLSSVADTSFWRSLLPKPLRSPSYAAARPGKKAKVQKGWNPATFFIFIFLLIGSMAIQMISLKKNFATFVRQSDVRIGLLREVVEKLQRGEEVDVEKVLGTGDPEKELAWEEVLKDIDREEPRQRQRSKKQHDPAPEPASSSEAQAPPAAAETPRAPAVQSDLATKGFF